MFPARICKPPFVKLLAVLLVAGFCDLWHPPAARADDEDVIEYRQHIMKSLNEQAAILGQIVSTAVPDDNVIAHLEVLALLASTAHRSFEPQVSGGKAKPEVWANWDDFSQRMLEFAEKTRGAADEAKAQGKENALASILNVLSCKRCHDDYREDPD